MRYLEARGMRYLYREVFGERRCWFSADTTRPVILDCGSNIGMAILFLRALWPCGDHRVRAGAMGMLGNRRDDSGERAARHDAAQRRASQQEGTFELYHDPDHPGSAVMSVLRSACRARRCACPPCGCHAT